MLREQTGSHSTTAPAVVTGGKVRGHAGKGGASFPNEIQMVSGEDKGALFCILIQKCRARQWEGAWLLSQFLFVKKKIKQKAL